MHFPSLPLPLLVSLHSCGRMQIIMSNHSHNTTKASQLIAASSVLSRTLVFWRKLERGGGGGGGSVERERGVEH